MDSENLQPQHMPKPTDRDLSQAEGYLVKLYPNAYEGMERLEVVQWVAEDLAEMRALGTDETEMDTRIRARLKTAFSVRRKGNQQSTVDLP